MVRSRPLPASCLPRYSGFQARPHEVRPGCQVHGCNAISWEESMNGTINYVDSVAFLGEWKIILQTLVIIIKREGISSEGSDVMPEFMGTEKESE